MTTNEEQNQMDSHESNTSWKAIILIQIIVFTTIIVVVSFTYLGAFPFDQELGIYRLLPGDILIDFIWLYIFSGIIGLILYFISPSISGFLLKLHRTFVGRNSRYYLQEIEPIDSTGSQIRRMLVPAFTALGLSYSISNIASVANLIVVTESFAGLAVEAQTILVSLSLLFILLLLSCFVLIFFVPIWIMQDIGLVRESEKKSNAISETEGVGNWYLKILKGFAGISTVVAYFFTILQTIEWYNFVLQSPPEGGFSILIFLTPVLAVIVAPLLALGPISFVYVLYQKSRTRNLSRFRVHAE